MEVLSSRMTFYYKRIFPALWVGIVSIFVVMAVVARAWEKEPMILVVPIVMLVFGSLLFRKLLWDLVDEVRDSGTALIVRKGAIEQRIPIADIVNVNMSQFTNPRRLSLRLRTPGKLGDEIAFIPAWSSRQFSPFSRNPIAESLIKRIDAARLGDVR